MTAERVRQEAELLAQAVAEQLSARDPQPTASAGGSSSRREPSSATGWTELLAGAALAARGGLDMVGAAVTRWADGAPRGGPPRADGSGTPSGRPQRTNSLSGAWAPPYDEDAGDTPAPAFHRAPRRRIPVRDGQEAPPGIGSRTAIVPNEDVDLDADDIG